MTRPENARMRWHGRAPHRRAQALARVYPAIAELELLGGGGNAIALGIADQALKVTADHSDAAAYEVVRLARLAGETVTGVPEILSPVRLIRVDRRVNHWHHVGPITIYAWRVERARPVPDNMRARPDALAEVAAIGAGLQRLGIRTSAHLWPQLPADVGVSVDGRLLLLDLGSGGHRFTAPRLERGQWEGLL